MIAWLRALLVKMNWCGFKEEKASMGLTGCGGREKGGLRTLHALGLMTVTGSPGGRQVLWRDHEPSFVFTGLIAPVRNAGACWNTDLEPRGETWLRIENLKFIL